MNQAMSVNELYFLYEHLSWISNNTITTSMKLLLSIECSIYGSALYCMTQLQGLYSHKSVKSTDEGLNMEKKSFHEYLVIVSATIALWNASSDLYIVSQNINETMCVLQKKSRNFFNNLSEMCWICGKCTTISMQF